MAGEDDREVTASELPREIGRTARRVLALSGYTTYDQLAGATSEELLKIHGVGPKAIRILTEHLAERGMAFRES